MAVQLVPSGLLLISLVRTTFSSRFALPLDSRQLSSLSRCSPRPSPHQFFIRETPRFLLKQGRRPAAVSSLVFLRNLPADHPYILEEVAAIESQIEDVSLLHDQEEREGRWAWFKSYWRGIWRYITAKGQSSSPPSTRLVWAD